MTSLPDDLVLRRATQADLPLLTALNMQLIEDQAHDNPASSTELEHRMRHWLSGAYVVGLIESGGRPVAYAVWRQDEEGIYLRQLFVVREHRRSGIGRRAFALLQRDWQGAEIRLDVLLRNERALGFWHSLGFIDYSLGLRRRADLDN